jgi:hypothetical protein
MNTSHEHLSASIPLHLMPLKNLINSIWGKKKEKKEHKQKQFYLGKLN